MASSERDTVTTRLRGGLGLVQSRVEAAEFAARRQWRALPVRAQEMMRRLVSDLFDLPSRRDVAALVDRLDDLDRRIDELARHRQLLPAGGRPAVDADAQASGETRDAPTPSRKADSSSAAKSSKKAARKSDAKKSDKKASKKPAGKSAGKSAAKSSKKNGAKSGAKNAANGTANGAKKNS